jgi:hypothetical protein
MLTIEFEPPVIGDPCECCGGHTVRLTRFVQSDGAAYAVYHAMFTDNHKDGYVSVLISIGEWADDAPRSQRMAFYVQIRVVRDAFQVGVRDAVDSPWGDVDILGPTLDRAEALAHPRIKEVFHITDHIVSEDSPIIEFLAKTTPS